MTDAFKTQREALTERRAKAVEERERLHASLEEEYGTAELPKKVRDLIWQKAWDDGHSYGEHEVGSHYEDLADIAKAATAAGPVITGEQMAAYLDHVANEAAKADAEDWPRHRWLVVEGRAFAYNAAGDFVSTRLRDGENKETLSFRLQAGMMVGVSENG